MPNKKATRNNANKISKDPVTPKYVYFYKGVGLPLLITERDKEYFYNSSIYMINSGILNGFTQEQQIVFYKKILDSFVEKVNKNDNFGLGESRERDKNFIIEWCVNINSLLNLNALTNDENNGIRKVYHTNH